MYKIGLKKYFELPFTIELEDFISVFHRWIQEDRIHEHVMIDVADYKHIPDGPGIMIIAHEGNLSIDLEDGQPGLLYMRKTPLKETLAENIKEVQSIVDFAAELLSIDPQLNGKIKFEKGHYRLITNDRFHFERNQTIEPNVLSETSKVFDDAVISTPQLHGGARLAIEIQ